MRKEFMDDQVLSYPVNMNHPLFLIRRAKDADVWMYEFSLAPLRFSHQGGVLDARQYVDNGVVVLPIITESTDKKYVQGCIDSGVAYSIHKLSLLLMGQEGYETYLQLRIFNDATGEFMPLAFDMLMKVFWSSFPMYEVQASVIHGELKSDGKEHESIVISWKPKEPWFKMDGSPLGEIPVPDSTTIILSNLKAVYDGMLNQSGLNVFDAQCAIKDMITNSILNKIYNCKMTAQRSSAINSIEPKLSQNNLNQIFKKQLEAIRGKQQVG